MPDIVEKRLRKRLPQIMKFADRVSRISVSQTMAVNEKALQMRAQGIDIVDFGAGEPDFPTPRQHQAGRHPRHRVELHAVHVDRRNAGSSKGHRRASRAHLRIELSTLRNAW